MKFQLGVIIAEARAAGLISSSSICWRLEKEGKQQQELKDWLSQGLRGSIKSLLSLVEGIKFVLVLRFGAMIRLN